MSILADLTENQLKELEWDWTFWGRPDQHLPPDDALGSGDPWSNWLILAGRGWGKTRTGSETVRSWVCGNTPLARGRFGRLALVAETAADARDVLVEGESGILAVHPKEFRPLYEPSKRRLTWPNGAIATLYNAVEPDQLRGPQHDAALCDELAKWRYVQETWDMLQFGLRLGTHPQLVITTTPRPIPLIKELIRDKHTLVTKGDTEDNRSNLAPSFIKRVIDKYAGTRLGRQELNAEILDDVPGALWTRAMFDTTRRKATDPCLPPMQRIVVAVDPSGTNGKDAGDEIGIVVAGKGLDGRGYLLADRSCSLSPAGWGRVAVQAYYEFMADRVVAEGNFGGAMVEHVIKTADPDVAYSKVNASRGKVVRAEPIAALYEQGRITHDGSFPALEDQMVQMSQKDGYIGEGSPDRLDAAVWAFTELMLEPEDVPFSWYVNGETIQA